jgi:hypothetical protein
MESKIGRGLKKPLARMKSGKMGKQKRQGLLPAFVDRIL